MADYSHKLSMQRIMANKASNTSNQSIKFTPGERALDTKFAKENSNFYDTVLPGINSNLDNLKKVTKMLGTPGNNLTGTGAASAITLGSFGGQALNPEAIQAYDLVRQVVQQDLRQTLGAQFTENEGKLMIQATYNPSLPPQMNQERLARLIKKTEQMKEIKDQQNSYFREKGTLRGFDYKKMRSDVSKLSKEIKSEFMPKGNKGSNEEKSMDTTGLSETARNLAKEFGL